MSKGFPVELSKPNIDFNYRLAIEGRLISGVNNLGIPTSPYSYRPYDAANTDGDFRPHVGRHLWIDSFILSAWTDAPKGMVMCELLLDNQPENIFNGAVPNSWAAIAMRAGDNVVVPYKNFVHEGFGMTVLTFPFIDQADTTKKVYTRFNQAGGYEITADLNFNADKTYMALGDSVFDGVGATKSDNMIAFKIRDYFNSLGEDCRLVNKALSGMSTNDFVKMLRLGYFEVENVDLITFCFGINDVAGTFGAGEQAQFASNIDTAIAWKKSRNPGAKMIFFGSSPVESNARNTKLDIARGIVSSRVAAGGGAAKKLYYHNLANAFNRTDLSFFRDADPNGDKVHPDDTGNQAIATSAINFITTNSIGLK
jgi:lysophospholipase L1-like esterase